MILRITYVIHKVNCRIVFLAIFLLFRTHNNLIQPHTIRRNINFQLFFTIYRNCSGSIPHGTDMNSIVDRPLVIYRNFESTFLISQFPPPHTLKHDGCIRNRLSRYRIPDHTGIHSISSQHTNGADNKNKKN